jgi:ACS family hexuronate transporter-like MFS transporter
MSGPKASINPATFTPMENQGSARWVMIGLGFTATLINYLDRQTLSVVAPVLIDEYHMTSLSYSWIVFSFMLAYTVMNAVWGRLIDRLGTRLGYALAVAAWSAAATAHALVTGPGSLALCRFMLGVGEAGNWPAGVKVVAEWFTAKERALASGIFNSGSAIGAIVAPPLVVLVVLKFGWRAAFAVVGAFGFIWVAAWSLIYYTPRQAAPAERRKRIPLWHLLRIRFVWSLILAKVFMDPAWYFYVFWFPEYLKRVRHFDLSSIGKYAWIPFLGAAAGNYLGGALCGAAVQRGISLTVARKGTVTIFAAFMASAIPAVLVHSSILAIVFVSIAMFGYNGCAAIMLAFPADVFPSDTVASVFGLAALGSGFGGMLSAPLTGWAVTHYSYMFVFFGFGLIPFVSVFVIWFFLGPLEPQAEIA